MINQLFWDFDGTLFDTYPMMVAAFKRALLEMDIDEVEIDQRSIYVTMRQHDVGTVIRKLSAFYGIDENTLRQLNKKYQIEMVKTAKPFKGVREVLEFVKQLSGHHYLLTHRDNQAKALLKEFDLLQYFTDFVTSDQKFPRKPKPDSINWLIDKNHVDRKSAIMIGDRKLDVQAGNNANIASCLFDPDGLIVETGNPDIKITEVKELIPWLSKR
ncbi:MAG: HAD-IA family hydrolase [Lentilactobacillus buchneri]|jgi:HAD superfamily hydrolase (TIGR01549 family)|uniref:HAD-IA family hydrolase n=1 Tax=Lentilactobacillus hilgardii TaxID=1588 RepID=A0A6P1EB76_LENHI|nr:HAD-IA family hydrolase [Lentilactobacillus hilgardii]MCI1922882.1 HAD-IA family hydrolase [Lentilactobacillus buchneri]RRG11412.1 MAG: HAD family hydrolase [Lactobacillus sp.]EEI69991.1 HAD hydrolase, family IA, variant 1 [Lentilactobacillus hilgardii ATCC 27305]MCI1950492.1 HAD-IA family hydrolase [Lentilactobacillus buchneri]MCI2019268.1 HAD-IA family hydrolase [Lentilactobacillus buchneri]